MSRFLKVTTVLILTMLGIWGCAKNPSSSGSQADRIRTLEARCGRLEEDYRSAAADRDKARKQAAQLEDERAELELKMAASNALATERDNLQKLLETRTSERDLAQAHLNALVSTIQQAIGKAQAQTPPSGPTIPVTTAPVINTAGANRS
jgi:peptidoglycan hydrolase CwlO-like protein